MTPRPGLVLITGAAGTIGTHLTVELAARGMALRLLDRRSPTHPIPDTAEFIHADLRDAHTVDRTAAGAAAIVHLGGITEEAPLTDLLDHNVLGTHHILQAAHRHRIPRVVIASSHHVTGLHPTTTFLLEHPEPEPDTFYAVSKITMEALARLYAHKTGIEVVALRIGSYRTHPTEPRHRATWLSPRDATTLIHAALTHPLPRPFLALYGTSDNPTPWWPRTWWNELGYHPTDTANDHHIPGHLDDRWHGGNYAQQPLPGLKPGNRGAGQDPRETPAG